ESRELLTRLELPRLRIIGIGDVERADPELAATRAGRTPWEYCWTAAPAICRYVLEREPGIEVLTYLDADLCLWSSPAPLFEELLPPRGPSDVPRRNAVRAPLAPAPVGLRYAGSCAYRVVRVRVARW